MRLDNNQNNWDNTDEEDDKSESESSDDSDDEKMEEDTTRVGGKDHEASVKWKTCHLTAMKMNRIHNQKSINRSPFQQIALHS